MKNLILETRNCVGYGYMSYLENGANQKVVDFMDNFCMWGGETKRFKAHNMYELSEEVMMFMQSDTCKSFLFKHNVMLITNKENGFNNALNTVFEN
ncbi:hypothetical protein AALB39_04275 [Lachnospiraceae bacterium 54-53]